MKFEVCPEEKGDCWGASIYPIDPPIEDEFTRWNAFYQALSDRQWKKVKHERCPSLDDFRADAFDQIPEADQKRLMKYFSWKTPGVEIWFEKSWPRSDTEKSYYQALMDAAHIPNDKEALKKKDEILARWHNMIAELGGHGFGFEPRDFAYEEKEKPRYWASFKDKPTVNIAKYDLGRSYGSERAKYLCDLHYPKSTSPSFPAKAKEAMKKDKQNLPPEVKARWFPINPSNPNEGSVMYWHDWAGEWRDAKHYNWDFKESTFPYYKDTHHQPYNPSSCK